MRIEVARTGGLFMCNSFGCLVGCLVFVGQLSCSAVRRALNGCTSWNGDRRNTWWLVAPDRARGWTRRFDQGIYALCNMQPVPASVGQGVAQYVVAAE